MGPEGKGATGAAAGPAIPPALPEGARYALVILTAMNLLNYLDRLVPSAVKDSIKGEFDLTDEQTSLFLSAFIVVYMLASPIFGSLADHWPRKALIAGGVAVWSLATGAAAFAGGFASLLAARACVGIGEAAYATIAPALLSDFYPPAKRNLVITIFYVAMPVGAALGYLLGGWIGEGWGWRAAFLLCGIPGLATAYLVLRVKDPGRGRFDAEAGPASVPWPEALRSLARNPTYLVAVAGYAAVSFATMGMADWLPAFLQRHHGMQEGEAGLLVGAVTVVGGLGGTLAGGWFGDRLRGRTRHPYLAVSALSMVPATGFAAAALVVEGKFAVGACLLLAQVFLWFYCGPLNALILNCVPAALRTRAFALSILVIHLLGDALSPPLIGRISDRIGPGGLPRALVLVPAAMAVGCVIWGLGWRRLAEPSDPAAAEVT